MMTNSQLIELLAVCEAAPPASHKREQIPVIKTALRLQETIWPGLPKWEPTTSNPQQDFYEAVIQGMREDMKSTYDARQSLPSQEHACGGTLDDAPVLMAVVSQDSPGPQTHEEARQFYEGFIAGATAYANKVGHSSLKSENQNLREVFDEQGWKTIENYERLAGSYK